jgi:1-phosphofructokinase family hexose kinase
MIVTVTPNTGIDYILTVPGLPLNRTVRASQTLWGMGGKATDVSWILGKLGVPSLALGFAAGWPGKQMQAMLNDRGVQTDFIEVDGETRINIILIQADGSGYSTFTARTLRVGQAHLEAFDRKYETALDQADCIVIGGSLPDGVPPEFFSSAIAKARRRDIPVVFDSSGPNLHLGVQAGPTVIKPNEAEIADLFGKAPESWDEISSAARQIQQRYGTAVVATLGARGALTVWGKACFRIPPLQLEVASAAGAGDGVLSGLALALAEAKPIEQGLRVGFALANAILLTPVTADFNIDDFERLQNQIELTPYHLADEMA